MGVRWTATFENDMISVQRLLAYTDLKNEHDEKKTIQIKNRSGEQLNFNYPFTF